MVVGRRSLISFESAPLHTLVARDTRAILNEQTKTRSVSEMIVDYASDQQKEVAYETRRSTMEWIRNR